MVANLTATSALGGRLLRAAVVALAAALPYFHVLRAPFVFDDQKLVVQNPLLRAEGAEAPLRMLAALDISSRRFEHAEVRENYRPLRFLSYWVDYELSERAFGDFDAHDPPPFFFHLQNVLWHVLNALLVLTIGTALLQSRAAGLVLALLFAVHPLHTEAVTYVSGRRDVLSTFFFLGALAVYVRSPAEQRLRWSVLLLVPLFFVLGLLSKEMVVTLPPVLLLADLVRRPKMEARRLLLHGFVWGLALVYSLAMLATPGLVETSEGTDVLRRAMAACVYVVRYLGLVLFPVSQSIDYSFDAIPILESPLASPQAAAAAVGVGVWLLAALWALRRGPAPLALGSLWFLGTLVPVLQFVPIAEPFAERFAYLPALGVLVLLAWGFDALRRRQPTSAWAGATVVVLSLLVAAWSRNRDWLSPAALWGSAVASQPRCARAYAGLGDAMRAEERWEEAAAAYERALEIWGEARPPSPQVRGHVLRTRALRGSVHSVLGRKDPALLERAVDDLSWVLEQVDSDRRVLGDLEEYAAVRMELAACYLVQEKLDAAAEEFRKVLRTGGPRATRARAQYFAGKVRLLKGDAEGAVAAYERALELLWPNDPSRVNVSLELADLHLERRRDADEAWRVLEDAEASGVRGPQKAAVLLRKAKLLDSRGEVQSAVEHLEAALDADSGSIAVLVTLAGIEVNLGRFERAESHFREALRRDPGSEPVRQGLQQLALRKRVQEDPRLGGEAERVLAGMLEKAQKHFAEGKLLAARDVYAALVDAAGREGKSQLAASGWRGIARVEAEFRRFRKAQEALERALALDPASSEVRAQLCKVLVGAGKDHFARGEVKDAVAAFERCLEVSGETSAPEVDEVRRLLSEIRPLMDED